MVVDSNNLVERVAANIVVVDLKVLYLLWAVANTVAVDLNNSVEWSVGNIVVVDLNSLVERVAANIAVADLKVLYLLWTVVVGLNMTVGSASASTGAVDYHILSLRSLQPQEFLMVSRAQFLAGTRLALAGPLVAWE